jgi:hypothetical protein
MLINWRKLATITAVAQINLELYTLESACVSKSRVRASHIDSDANMFIYNIFYILNISFIIVTIFKA